MPADDRTKETEKAADDELSISKIEQQKMSSNRNLYIAIK